MHHGILVKVRGNTEEAAKYQLEQIMDDTLCCGTCGSSVREVNWDGWCIVDLVDKAWIKKHRSDLGIETVTELIQHYIGLRDVTIASLKSKLLNELKKFNEELVESGNMPKYSMLTYYIRQHEELREVLDFGEADKGLYTLHCTNNHYSDQTENSHGESFYCFWVDRHY